MSKIWGKRFDEEDDLDEEEELPDELDDDEYDEAFDEDGNYDDLDEEEKEVINDAFITLVAEHTIGRTVQDELHRETYEVPPFQES